MATFDSIFVLEGGNAANLSVAAGASSAAQAAGVGAKFAIIGAGDFHIVFGPDAVAAASANSIRVPGNSFCRFDMGQHTTFRVFNPGGSAIAIQWIYLHG